MAPYALSKTLFTVLGLISVGLTALASASVNSSQLLQAHDHASLEMHGRTHYESHGHTIPHLEARANIGQAVLGGVNLRILPLGDSITYGTGSSDGNGYRERLEDDLANNLVYAGTVQSGDMLDNWMAGYPGQTISYIANAAGPSLQQNPNIVLLLAGTNDMNPNPVTSKQGSNPNDAANALGKLIDQILTAVPSTVVLVAKLPQVKAPAPNAATQNANTQKLNDLIPGLVSSRSGKHVQWVDLSTISGDLISSIDGIHPTDAGYVAMGDKWSAAIANIPAGWVKAPIGKDPGHLLNCNGTTGTGELSPVNGGTSTTGARGSLSANGGPDPNIPAPVFHHDKLACEIALGLGHPGDWKYHDNWVSGGRIVTGLKLDMPGVQLFDMDGDGKAEYLWINQKTGELTCWINAYPDLWHPCGNNNGIIASGACPRDNVFLADMNGDGKTDYLCVNENTGAVTVYWNEGPDPNFVNGWRFTPGGVIATGVPHANLRTLRFADMDGDGRADYVVVGVGGSLGLYLNTGTQGGHDVLFVNVHGIATGASSNIDNVVLHDVNGDGRADYLIWDSIAGLSGYLNIRTRDQGTPFFAAQGGAKSIADGISQQPGSIRLADIDGDGYDDYCYIDEVGALFIWWNRGGAQTDASVTGDAVRLADLDGDNIDDYIWLDEVTGAPTGYLNKGPKAGAPDGWFFAPQNGGQPIASGAGRRENVHFGDIDGDNRTDYLVLDPKTGAVNAYLNGGYKAGHINSWIWNPVGQIASGLGPGENARFADIDGDGKMDYIQLHLGGRAEIWKNQYPGLWKNITDVAGASGINRPPAEITFADMDGDGKADYIWTEPISGQPHVWYNRYPAKPTWQAGNYLSTSRDGVSGPSILYARLTKGNKAVPVFVNPDNGAIAAFVNSCGPTKRSIEVSEPHVKPLSKRELRRRDTCSNGGGALSPSNGGAPLVPPHQGADDAPNNNNHYWCYTTVPDNVTWVREIWEDNYSVGQFLSDFIDLNGPERWLARLTETLPNGIGGSADGCGQFGGACALEADHCYDIFLTRAPQTHWILQAARGLHNRVNIAHEALQDDAISTTLQLDDIAADFSAPQSNAAEIASIVSAAFFMFGGVAGIGGVLSSEIATAATVGVVKAEDKAAVAVSELDIEGAYQREQAAEEKAAAEQTKGGAQKAGRSFGALAGGPYLVGSILSEVSAVADPKGQVSVVALEDALSEAFNNTRTQLSTIGMLALGYGGPGADYGQLPFDNGTNFDGTKKTNLRTNATIAGFFSDGKMLLDSHDPSFMDSINGALGNLRARVVDTALQSAGVHLFAMSDYTTKKACYGTAITGYGAQWLEFEGDGGYCLQLYRPNTGKLCPDNQNAFCDWAPASHHDFDLIQGKYHINTVEYMRAAFDCSRNGPSNRRVSTLLTLPDFGQTPTCFYNMLVQRAKINAQPVGPAGGITNRRFLLSSIHK